MCIEHLQRSYSGPLKSQKFEKVRSYTKYVAGHGEIKSVTEGSLESHQLSGNQIAYF